MVYNTIKNKHSSKQLPQYDDIDIPDGIENISDPDMDEEYEESLTNQKIPRTDLL